MAAKKTISISWHKISDKYEKTTFPKEFFFEIWFIIEDCKYNYTTAINLKKKKLFGCTFMGENKFWTAP